MAKQPAKGTAQKAVQLKLSPELTKELRAAFRTLPLSNGFMFGEVMRVAALCVTFLERLLGVEIDHVEYLSKEHDISDSFTGHGIRIDVYLRDDKGTVYSIEMDTSGDRELYALRVRFYQGTIDRNSLERGADYTELPQTFLIIISTQDFFGKGLALYKRKMLIEGYQGVVGGKHVSISDFAYNDGTTVYFLNAAYKIDNVPPEIKQFLDCIRKNDINPDHYESQWMKDVCARVSEVRADPAEEAYYMQLNVMMMDERRKGREEGAITESINIYRDEMRFDDQTIIQKLMAKFNLAFQDAAGYVNPKLAVQ